MVKNCKICKDFQKHYYWRHYDRNKLSFLKKMEGLCYKQMTLPSKFTKNLKAPLGKIVQLKPETGATTKVTVARAGHDYVFTNGWKDFVISNKIKPHDLLLFRHCDVSSFKVTVCDVLPKEEEEESSESVQIVEPPPINGKVKVEAISISSSETRSSLAVKTKRVYETEKVGTKGARGRPRKHLRSINVKKEHCRGKPGTSCHVSPSFIVPEDMKLTKGQETIAMEMVCNARMGNPLFIHIMCTSDFSGDKSGYMEIPDNFAPEILKKDERTIVLRVRRGDEEKKWDCWYSVRGMKAIGGAGWAKFKNENRLKRGDLCLFELVRDECKIKLTMNVHVHSV